MEVESKVVELQGKKYFFRPNYRCLLEYEKISGKARSEENRIGFGNSRKFRKSLSLMKLENSK